MSVEDQARIIAKERAVDDTELLKLQKYLNELFGIKGVRVKFNRKTKNAEVELNDEFIATIYRDEDEGEVSYSLTMAILQDDIDATS